MRTVRSIVSLLALMGAAAALPASAATIVWGGGNGVFGTAANWVGGSAPGSNDTASFDGWIPLPQVGMTATASKTGGSETASNAIDGRVSTRWAAGAFQAVNDWFEIDLGASMTFSRVDLDCGSVAPGDYPRGFSLAVSNDNSSFTTVTTGAGVSALTSITFANRTARYIKVTLTAGSGSSWWGIAEYTVYGSSAWVPLSTSGWTATAYNSNSGGGETTNKSLDGDRGTRWGSGQVQAIGAWYKVDMGSARTFSRVEMDQGSAINTDYARNFTLAVSSDDSSYTTVTTTSGTALTNVIFAARTARYIKITLTSANASFWFSFAEFRVFTPTQSTLLSRNGWTPSASSSDGGNPLASAIDSNTGTHWATGALQTNGQWFKVDMTQSLSIDAVTMDAYGMTGDFAQQWKLETSTDNSIWTTVTANQTGTNEYVHYQFAMRTARYVRVTQTGSSGTNWWSIAEFNVYGTPANASVSSNATVSSVNIAGSVTLTQASGVTLTIAGDFNQSAGTFTGGNSLISVGGDFNLSGGAFTATSGILEVSGAFNDTGGTFTPNSGRVLLDSTTDQTFATNDSTFYDLAINDGLVAYWKMDNSASPATDASGWARSATWAGSATSSTTVPSSPGPAFANPRSVSFASATSDRATFTSPTVTDVTIAAWVQSSARNNSFPRILEMPAYQLSFADSNQSAPQVNSCVAWSGLTSGAQFGYRSPAGSITDGTWYHVAATMTSAGVGRIYINGVLQTTTQPTAGSGTVISNAGTGYLGNRAALDRGWTGKMDDVRIYNRILSAQEINSLSIGNQPGTSLATQTMTGAPTVSNDLVLAAGKLAIGGNDLIVGGNWLNYGGLFTSSSTVFLTNGCCTDSIRSAGQPFYDLSFNGVNGTWSLEDWLKVTNTMTFNQNGTLSAGAYAIHAGNIDKVSGSLAAGTGTVVLDSTSSVLESSGFSFNDLRVEAPDESGLVGYWKFDEGQGTTIGDLSGTGNNGLLTAVKWTASVPPAISFDNHAGVVFDGSLSNSYASLGTTAIPANNASQSVAFWVNTGTQTGAFDHYMFSAHNGSNSGVSVGLLNSNGTLAVWKWGATALVSTSAPSTGSWHHVAYTYDGTTHTLYVDGSSASTSAAVANTATPTVVQLGSYNSSASFTGSIDDLRVYNAALTATQVRNLYAGRYSGAGSATVVTLGANSTVTDTLAIDSGTLSASSYTMNASSAGSPVTVGSGGTYTVGSAAQTMAGGLTVSNAGTVNLATSGGKISIGSGKTLGMDGTLNASSAGATIQSVSGTYAFSVGSTATATPTLNITGLTVKNTDGNGMNINANHGASTTFTRFDNIAFANGAGTGAGNYNLQIYAPALYLTSSGCTFDSGVNATVATNIKLSGNGTADGETRALFGSAICASNKSSCDAYDLDDNTSPGTGVGLHPSTDGAIIQWIKSAAADTAGSIEGFPTAAFDWSSFTYYATYVDYHDASGTADRVYVRTTTGAPSYQWDTPSGVDLIGAPRWDTVAGVHYVYVATTSGKVYRLVDGGSSLTADTASPWNGANNPFDCGCTIVTPLAQDTSNLYFGGVAAGTYKLWTLSKTSTTRQPLGSPLATGATTSNAAPAIWASGDTYAFLGQGGRVTKLDTTTQVVLADNINPGATNAVTGRITVLLSTLYAGDDNGYMWSLDPGANFGASSGTFKNWGYHDATHHATCGGVCQVKNHYVDAQYQRVYYGDQDGHVYVINSSGSAVTGYPWRPGTSSDAFATSPLYRAGVVVIGSGNGFLYVIDQSANGSLPAMIQTYRFGGSGTSVSGVAYDSHADAYMISTANATSKDGKLYYITSSSDPTPASL